MTVPFPPVPASGLRIDEMSPNQMWSAYIRYTGAGAVLAAGLITLARTIPTIVSSFRDSMKDFGAKGAGAAASRTERDMPLTSCSAARVLLALFLAVAPGLPTQGNFLASILVVVFGFFFVTVSSRIVGLIGSSSNPDLRHDDRDADPDLHDLRRARLDRRVVLADRAVRRRGRLHRRRERRRDVAGPEDRLHRRRDADLPAVRADHRRARLGADHRLHDAVPAQRHDASDPKRCRRRRRR